MTLEDNQKVLLYVPQNPANQFVEAHVIFPTSITADNPNVVNEDKFDEILAQEAALAEEEQRNAWLFGILSAVLAVVAPVLPMLVFLWIRKARKREKSRRKSICRIVSMNCLRT